MASTFRHLFTVDDVTLGELAERTDTVRLRASVVAFWIAVIGLVGARIAYVDPYYSHTLNYVAELGHSLLSVIS